MGLAASLLYSLITWPFYIILGFVLYIVGLILVPLALLFKAYEDKFTVFGYFRTCWTWRIMAPWQNYEDSIAGPLYYQSEHRYWQRVMMWTCFRNPVSGLRWLPIVSIIPQADKIQYIGSYGTNFNDRFLYELKLPCWYYIWQNAYSCLWWQFRLPFTTQLWRFWLGNGKLYPADKARDIDYGYRKYGTTGVTQLKRVQEGANRN